MAARPRSIRIEKGIRIFRRRDSLVWQFEVRLPGRERRRYSLDLLDENEALAVARKRAEEIHEGRTGVAKPKDATYEEMLEAYKKHAELRNEPGTRELNYANLERIAEWLRTHLGVRRLQGTDFTADLIERYLQYRRKQGRSADTVNRERGTLSSFFERCRKKGIVRANPLAQVDALPTPRKRVPRTVEPPEIARLLQAADAPVDLHGRGGLGQGNTRVRFTPLHDLILFVLNTGARQGEALHLEWQDADLRSGLVRLVNKEEHRLKDRDERVVRMNGAVRRLLQRRKVRSGGISWVFPSAEGGPLDRRNVYRELRGALRRAGLRDVDFNVLRHTALTQAARSGIPPFALKELAGHGSIRTTERFYLGAMGSERLLPPEVGT
jgi:integrase